MRSVLEAAARLIRQASRSPHTQFGDGSVSTPLNPPSIERPDSDEQRQSPLAVAGERPPVVDVDQILAMYARGMTVREIQVSLGADRAAGRTADFPHERVAPYVEQFPSWQSRPLEVMYPLVIFDSVGIRTGGPVAIEKKGMYFALAVLPDGSRDVLGLWMRQTEGPNVWTEICSDLKARGCRDILIAVADDVDDVCEAIAGAYPATTLLTCIVQLIRRTLECTSRKERANLSQAVRPIYAASGAKAAVAALDDFEQGPWGKKLPAAVALWRQAWPHVIPFFALPAEIRRVIYTTNSLMAVHAHLSRRLRTYGPFSSDQAAKRLVWLLLQNIAPKWRTTVMNWRNAKKQFATRYPDRFVRSSVDSAAS